MKEIRLVCGLSGSGKSYFAEKLKNNLEAENFRVDLLSSDSIRQEVFGDINDQTHNIEVFQIIHKKIREWAQRPYDGNDFLIIDATNITRKNRMAMLNELGKAKTTIYKQISILATPFEICVENDSKRDRKVGREVIFRQMSKFEMPQKYEGWDSIEVIDKGKDYYNKIELLSKMIGFNQNNPHHKYSLFEHSMKTMYEAIINNEPKELIVAAKYHDIGKLFTQTTDENGVSHYYGHANVSTYYMLVNRNIWFDEILDDYIEYKDVLFIINYHMIIRDIVKNCPDRYKRLWGPRLYNLVSSFVKYDEIATGIENHKDIK